MRVRSDPGCINVTLSGKQEDTGVRGELAVGFEGSRKIHQKELQLPGKKPGVYASRAAKEVERNQGTRGIIWRKS